jgi:RNA polymerase II-associated factor 1
MESDGDHFLAYYLTKDDESAFTFKDRRFVPQLPTTPEERESAESTAFHFVRDYETVKVEQDVPNEFLLVLDDGDEAEVKSPAPETARRVKGAYYKNIERKMNLKKKRVIVRFIHCLLLSFINAPLKVHEIYDQKWDVIHIRHGAMDKEEEAEREELLAEITDPDYLLGRDADGEPEAEFDADGVSDSRGVMTQDGNRDVDVDVDVEGMGVPVSVSISEVDIFG